MSTPAYISIEGSTQGNITQGAFTLESIGNGFVEGHEDQILAQQVDHNITVPTDPQSGQPAGQRTHKPFIFTCALNKSVPLLYNALASGESLTKVEVNWYRTAAEGKQEHFFTTIIEDATIVDINCNLPHAQLPDSGPLTQLIKVSLAYRKVTWEHVAAGTSGSDDWRAPLEA